MSLDERRLTEFMHGSVDGLHHPDRWAEVPRRAAVVARRRRTRLVAAGAMAAAATVIAVVIGVSPPKSQSHHVQVGHQSTLPTSPSAPSTSAATSPPSAPELPPGYLPLYPFGSSAEVAQWETTRHPYADSGQTALGFAHFLGYSEVDQVIAVRSARDGDHVSIGFTIAGAGGTPAHTPAHTAAIVHLVPFGPGGPWEVVGTDDTTFTLSSPPYGSKLGPAYSVGGTITGVDESITVKVFRPLLSAPVVDSCCHPAGGTDSPWSVQLPGPVQYIGILIVAASTGGHVAQVERFAVTGLRGPG